jgi:signal transduction histidine kinase
MRLSKGITRRITLLGWVVTLVTLAVFVTVIVPEQKHEFQLNLESKARGVAASIRGVAAGAAVSEDYSAVVDQAMQVLSADQAIDYVVITKNDGFSIVIDRTTWKIEKLGDAWHPVVRTPSSSIGSSPLFGRRVFQYAFPFDYSGIQWGWIHVGLSLDAYDESVRRTYKSTGALSILCGALSLLISLLYAARLVRPIHILRTAVDKVAHGDLYARAEVHSGDEIERLAEAFNEMARTILGRNQILESVSFAAKQFLSAADPDAVSGEVLARIGQATGASRAYVLKRGVWNGPEPTVPQQEWTASGTLTPPEDWESFPWQREQQSSGWIELLNGGQVVTAKSAQLEKTLGDSCASRIQSMMLTPVVVADVWWGVIGIDDFLEDRDWGEAERDSIRAVADMLGASIARQRVQSALVEAKETLEQRVRERTGELQEQVVAKDQAHAELAAAQQRLIELSRQAGMAEVATGVLHNVGNVLNSINVTTSLVAGKIRDSRVDNLVSLIEMLQQHPNDLSEFVTQDAKGQRVLPYLAKLGGHFQSERVTLLEELELLVSHVGHVKQIVATQQNYAKMSGLVENVRLSDMVDDALRILEPGLLRYGIKVERDFETLPSIAADKHQILQILLNLLRNAQEAVKQGSQEEHRIRVCIRRMGESRISLAVEDSGVGLPPENLTRIFAHGFTTKADGHGFGLHSCALAARQMAGSLRAESQGLGRGATFILELPLTTSNGNKEKSVT